jgi:alpha-1,3-rhamnosyl/mannosyltransferase
MLSARRPTIVIDATPLRTPSGVRGIGRYLFDLLYGLDEVRSLWEDDLDLIALTDLSWGVPPSLSRDLRAAAEETSAQKGTVANETMRRLRQLRAPAALRATSAALFHQTEALGTPLWGPPRLVTLYDLIPLRYPTQYLKSRTAFTREWVVAQRRYSTALCVAAISRRTREDAIALLHVDPRKVSVVPTGIDLSRWYAHDSATDERRREAVGVGSRPYALFVGYGDHRKNTRVMFEAIARARRSMDIELVWAGKLSEPLLARLQREAKDAGIDGRVRFLGYVNDDTLSALYAGAVAEVFVSRLEGFGLPVAEAMAARCPVIVARNSGCDEVVGEAGYVVDPDDVPAIADILVALHGDPTLRAERGAAGAAQAQALTRSVMAQGYVALYREAIEALRSC